MRFADPRRRYTSLRIVILIGACGTLSASTQAAVSIPTKQRPAVGSVYQILEDTVLLRGKLLDREKVALYAGNVFNTKEGGSVIFKLNLKNATCTMNPGGILVVNPAKLVATKTLLGSNWCYAAPSNSKVTFKGGKANVQTSKDPVFSITVRRNHTVVVKVSRGFVVLATRKGGRTVLGKKTQVTVSSAGKPQAPTGIQLTKLDTQTIKEVSNAAHLTPPTDTTSPATQFGTKPDPTTPTTDAMFEFLASEPNVIFACSLDGDQFRPCLSPKTLAGLAPGLHTFAVQATDQAGNTGKPAAYSWTVQWPASSPIAFESNRDGNYEIYVMNPDGSGETRLTDNPDEDVDPAWSPDGRRLAFESTRDTHTQSEIYVMNADGSGQTRLTTNPAVDRDPKWSPLGNKIAFESDRDGNNEIYVMNSDGSNPIRLTTDPASDADPAWSPDGKQIAFESARDGSDEIYVMNSDGSNQTRLTTNAAEDTNPVWSPDGTKIAFESDRDSGNHEIYLMNADGSKQIRLTANAARDSDPTWSPDGSRIAFASDRDGNFEIYLMNADGSNPVRLTNSPARDIVPNW